MKKQTRQLLGGIAIAAGALVAAGAYLKKNKMGTKRKPHKPVGDVWARPGMLVTFRAEVMPGKDRDERTFRVKELLSSGRVLLQTVDGEHAAKEFEALH